MIVYSLFDGSGYAVKPLADAGHTCFCFNYDDADHGDYHDVKVIHHNIEYVNAWIDEHFEIMFSPQLNQYPYPDLILSFTPCTDLANSGSRWWKEKAKIDPDFQIKAARTARIAERIANYYNVPYMVENPVGRLSTLWRKPDHVFEPYQYGGYLCPHEAIHPAFPDVIPPYDAYPKKTCLWVGNGFKIPAFAPVEPVSKDNPGWAKTGGKSQRTKMIRSLTPRGLAKAICAFNEQ